MKIIKKLILVFFLSHTLINFVSATELGGIKILQSTYGLITDDENPKRQRNYDKNVKIFLNTSFNLSFLADERYVSEKTKRFNDFLIPKPDFFFDGYYVLERDGYIIFINSFKELADDLDQSSFKVRECESLKEQLISEKLDLTTKEKKYSKQYLRKTSNEEIGFKDRTIFEYNGIVHFFTCLYVIDYDDSVEKHFVFSRLFEGVALKEEFNKKEKFSNYQNIEKFDSNYIKNFKIWGNLNEVDFDDGEIFSLTKYRSESFLKHQIEVEEKEKKSQVINEFQEKKSLVKDKDDTEVIVKVIETQKKLIDISKLTQDQDRNVETNKLTLNEEDALRAQIFGCWSVPIGSPYNEDLLVRIKLSLNRDGTISKIELLDQDRMNKPGQEFYKVLAESALRAVKLCQPLSVPNTNYERWRELQLNFDAREMLKG